MASLCSSGRTSEKETRNWLELPRDLTSSILSKLGAVEILNSAQNVCTIWRNVCKDQSMWRSIDMHNAGELWNMQDNLEIMCRHAVDRSCGGLISINLEFFATDSVMNYIADRSSSLRSLRLVSCYYISSEGLIEAIAKLTMLEEIEISNFEIHKEALEAIGRSCPLLKTFKYNKLCFRDPHIESDVEALAIATTMHELRHLHLFGNKLTNIGLSAILDGCPHLEYLDLRWCFNVNLVGDLEKRCLERIKILRRPYDSTDDYEFRIDSDDIGSSEEDYLSEYEGLEYDGFGYEGLEYDDFTNPFSSEYNAGYSSWYTVDDDDDVYYGLDI